MAQRRIPDSARSSFADRLFAAKSAHDELLDQLSDELFAIFAVPGGGHPFEEISHDYYDCSFELHGCADDLVPSPEQRQACWALGFQQCWLNYKDNTEVHFYEGQAEESRRTPK